MTEADNKLLLLLFLHTTSNFPRVTICLDYYFFFAVWFAIYSSLVQSQLLVNYLNHLSRHSKRQIFYFSFWKMFLPVALTWPHLAWMPSKLDTQLSSWALSSSSCWGVLVAHSLIGFLIFWILFFSFLAYIYQEIELLGIFGELLL